MKILLDIHIVGKTGGAIPCEKPRKTVFGNILLAGDAAGHTHPITGAGILNAMIAGEIAGRTAAQEIKRGYLSMQENYETEWHEAFGNSLIYGALKRQWMEENWNRPGIEFETLIRKTWVGFKEYYEDRKKTQEQSI
jgi:digeranylgeranylglycerophospholipid reductase